MAKADYTRDYYADLELSSTADVADIKKQFRKLALKYHPDRNPGKEAEVQAKFQTIQAAHEILTSPEQKQKYDSQRTRSRYPGASGVRGNPWQDYGSQFPTPPRRPGQAPTSAARNNPASFSSRPSASSANTRYSNFNPPPTAKTSKEDLDSRYSAWQKMRPKPAGQGQGQSASAAYAAANANTRKKASAATGASTSMPPPPAPPPPPRTASQRQKADASFGTRRNTGFAPSSPTGDEPAASSKSNYFTARPHPTRVPEQAEPPRTPAPGRESRAGRDGRASRNSSDESLFDARQSTPYQTHGGEKFSLFDDVPVSELHRAKSHRAADGQARPQPRRRSSSVPDESDSAAKASTNGDFNGGASSTANMSAPRTGTRTRPGAGQRPSYASSSSTMPMFDEQYQKVQSEHEKQQQQQQQQQDPFNTPAAKQARKPVPNGTSDKGKPDILYGNSPQQLPKQTSQQIPQYIPKQAPKESSEKPCLPTVYLPQQYLHSYMHMNANQEKANSSYRNSAFAQHGSDPFLGKPNAEISPPCVPHPSTNPRGPIGESPLPPKMFSQDNRGDMETTRDQWFSMPPTNEGLKSHFSGTYRSPAVTVTSLANSKRRATTCPTATMPPSGGSPTTSTANVKAAENTLKALRRSMNEFEVRQFTVLESLVSSAGPYQPDAPGQAVPNTEASGVQSDASSVRQASHRQEHFEYQREKHPLHHYPGATAQPPTRCLRDTNSGHLYSANLSLNDDVFNSHSPTSPVGQQRSNPFSSISVEDINTRFVSDDNAKSAWQFSAGGSEAEPGQEQPHKIHRMQSGNRLGRRSPGKAQSIPRPDPSQGPPIPPKVPSRPTSSTGGATDGNTDSASGSSVDGGGSTQRANANIFNLGGINKQQSGSTTTTTDYFDPHRWTTQFGSEHFQPPSNQGPTLPPRIPTPNHQQPRPIKKPKPVSRTNTSTATQPNSAPEYIVIEDSDDDSVVETNGEGLASPVAMDIDSPPTGRPVSGGNTADAGSSTSSSPSRQAAGGVRNIPVEPTRPEWRAGHVDNNSATAASASTPINPFAAADKVKAMAAAAAAAVAAESASGKTSRSVPPPPPAMGSEDSEEFRATLADIRKVEPFAENDSGIQGKAGAGLGSFSDLKSQLPFDSKAATPLKTGTTAAGSTPRSGRAKTISFPTPPMAPSPPPTIAVPGMQINRATWDKYVLDFKKYIVSWGQFNQMYTDHFVARQRDLMRGARQPRAAGDRERDRDRGSDSTATAASGDWVSDADNAGIDDYLEWLEQDEEVRVRWEQASAKHRENVKRFRQYREVARQAQM